MKKYLFVLLIVFVMFMPLYADPVRIIVPRTAIALAATGTTFNITAFDVSKFRGNYGARATRYILECPDMTGNGTTTLSIIDANSVTVFAGSAHNENANYSVAMSAAATPYGLELVGSYTFRLTLSLAAGGTGATAYLTVLGE